LFGVEGDEGQGPLFSTTVFPSKYQNNGLKQYIDNRTILIMNFYMTDDVHITTNVPDMKSLLIGKRRRARASITPPCLSTHTYFNPHTHTTYVLERVSSPQAGRRLLA
jgi:hypothetical protein